MHYTTRGNVRGTCGHKHGTIDTAAKCLHRDQIGCNKQGGYSDREVVEVDADGRQTRLDEADYLYADHLIYKLSYPI